LGNIWCIFIFPLYFILTKVNIKQLQVTYTEYENILDQGLIQSARVIKDESNNFEFYGKLKTPITISINGKPKEITEFTVKLGFVDAQTENYGKRKV